MPSFGIIAEGPTDQAVIRSILRGYFDEEQETQQIQPPSNTDPGGWTVLFKCFQANRHKEALQFNDYLIIQIDTDVSEEAGFDVSKRSPEGIELSPQELATKVIERLQRAMGEEFCRDYIERLIFAISVHSIECWFLPILFASKPVSAGKITGCLEAVRFEMKLQKLDPIANSNGDKDLKAYQKLSKELHKRKNLLLYCPKNPSLALFIAALDRCFAINTPPDQH